MDKIKKLTFIQYLWKNSRWPLGWIAITSLFIIYWLVFPDNSSTQAIRGLLITWGVLAIGIPAGLLYTYKKKYLPKYK